MLRYLAAASVLALMLGGASAYAQDSSGDEIVVTAQRREQAAQDVPVALSVVTAQTLIDNGVSTVNGLENLTPSLDVESQFGSGQPSFTLRGVGFKDYASNNAPTVGVYVDDVAYTAPIMTQGLIYDVARVEVLRGPQGTLYGRNTTGGAINIITQRPTDEFHTGLTAEYGNYDALYAEGYVSGPLGGGAAARLSFATAQGGAWQRNRETGVELGDADRFAIRGQVEVPANSALNFLLNVHYYTDQSDGLGLQLFKDFGGAVTTPAALAHLGQRSTSWGASSVFAAATGIGVTQKPFRDNEGYGASLTTRLHLNFADLTYIASREVLDRNEYNDFDAVPQGAAGTYFNSDIEVNQHEIRLQSPGDEAFDWIVGLYYAKEDLRDHYQSDFADSFGPAFGYVSTPYRQEVETLGVFGQIEYQITPTLNFVGGLRYEDEQRDLRDLGTFAIGFGALNFANGLADGTLESRSTEMQEVSGKIGLEWRPTDDVLYYASISRGVKSGGFTAYNTLNSHGVDPFDPEVLWAYEVGFKSDLANNTLRLNGALYYYDYTDQQVQGAIYDSGIGAVVGKIVNAPQSEIYGAELELLWRPIEGLEISQVLGYAHGEFKEFDLLNTAAPPATIDESGARIGFPEFTYNGGISYEHGFGGGWSWIGSVDYSYRSDSDPPLLKPVSGEGYGIEGYWLVNANIAIRPDNGHWEFALWGRNLTDEDYDETRNFFAGSDFTPIAAPGLPRTYGVRVSLRY